MLRFTAINLHRGLVMVLLVLCFMQLCAPFAYGVNDIEAVQEELDKGQEDISVKNNLWWEFIKLVFFLLLIIAASGWVIRFLNQNARARSQGVYVHIVDEVVLGQNRGIALCEVGGKLYGLGITEHHINLLFETENPKLLEEISRELLPDPQNQPGPLSLSKILGHALFPGNHRQQSTNNRFSQMVAEQASRLQDMIAKQSERNPSDKQ